MKLKHLIILISLFLIKTCYGQKRIIISETTIKVKGLGVKELYFGFDNNDQIIFNFELIKGKNLNEVEIIEFPNNSVFMDYKTTIVNEKHIDVKEKGIYLFRFKNTSLSNRICKIRIERVPFDTSNLDFNTNVYWKTIVDTNFYMDTENYLVSIDTIVYNLTDKVIKVHSLTNSAGNKSTFNFTLPKNTISWSYYIGVEQEGLEAFENATKEIAKKSTPLISKIPGYGPLAALALGGTSYLTQLQRGEDIDYYIVDGTNLSLFLNNSQFHYLKNGKIINDFSKMPPQQDRNLFFCFSNDNEFRGVTVNVKITAIVIKKNWETRKVQKYEINSFKEPYLKE